MSCIVSKIICPIVFIFLIGTYKNSYPQLVPDFKVSDADTASSFSNNSGKLDVDAEGNYVVVWQKSVLSTVNVFGQLFDRNSNRVGSNFRVNEVPDSSSSPDIAVYKNGNFAVCWTQRISTGGGIRIQLFDKFANPINMGFFISDSLSGVFGRPWIDVNSRGEYIVTWDYRPNIQSTETIYYQTVDSLGNKIGSNRIADDTVSRKDAPYINIFPDDRFVITWADERMVGANKDDIYFQMFDADGNKIGVNERVYNDTLSNEELFPKATSDSLNNFCICFTEFDILSVKTFVRCQLYNSDGSKKGESFWVRPTGDSEQFKVLDSTPNGKILVGFDKEQPDLNYIPFFQRLDSSGGYIGIEYRVTEQFSSVTKFYTDVKISGDKIISLWGDEHTGNAEVYCNVRSFSNPDSTVGISQVSSEIPAGYILHQNYPNPFNPVTKIKFDIPRSAFIILKVYDILGREIETLVNEELSAGGYEYIFDAERLTSGIYIYKLESEGRYSAFKKMVLIK